MKILTLSNYFPEHQGGIEFVAMNLVKHWRVHHQVKWMACNIAGYLHHCAPDDIPLPAINFTENKLGFPYPIPVGGSFSEIFKHIRKCDVVHIHDCLYLANLVAFFASRRYGKPLLVTQHVAVVPYQQAYKNAVQEVAYQTLGRLVLKNAEGVVFISQRVKAWFENHVRFHHQVSLISNGVDRGLFYPAPPQEREETRNQFGCGANDFILLFVGRFTQKKGLDLIHEIAKARPHIRWILIGRNELEPRLWNLPNVQVLPPQSQSILRKYYVAADLFFLPSVGEGFPLALQEALSCGLPAAVSKELAEYMPDAPLITLDTSSHHALLSTLDELRMHHEQLTHLRNEAREYAKRWDWVNVASQYEMLFTELIRLRSDKQRA